MPSNLNPRGFPPPWTIEEHNDACFIVRDNTGQAVGYFYFEDEPGRRSADVRFEERAIRRLLELIDRQPPLRKWQCVDLLTIPRDTWRAITKPGHAVIARLLGFEVELSDHSHERSSVTVTISMTGRS